MVSFGVAARVLRNGLVGGSLSKARAGSAWVPGPVFARVLHDARKACP
ncbi:hypothetical protein [Amycolatopsis rubida]|uniref:Uncharacterized protein n=1 Tax=Amycolatopsis rubida TaxID=112413 RepID=A0A1I5X7F8_9PSEU|nr:hypothetical protein [Amycolatopsis rubida]SFQ27900.1 hypothetical protein SAMN05421854_11077 [Amycolatopsis rubida]